MWPATNPQNSSQSICCGFVTAPKLNYVGDQSFMDVVDKLLTPQTCTGKLKQCYCMYKHSGRKSRRGDEERHHDAKPSNREYGPHQSGGALVELQGNDMSKQIEIHLSSLKGTTMSKQIEIQKGVEQEEGFTQRMVPSAVSHGLLQFSLHLCRRDRAGLRRYRRRGETGQVCY